MDTRDITLLRIVDGLWETYEWVPLTEIEDRISWRLKLKKRISDLQRLKLIRWDASLYGEPAIKITEKGQDTLAVWDFRKHGVIDEIGNVIGEGKEAIIVTALKDGEKRVIKFHKYYSAEFHKIKRSLSYSVIKYWKKKIRRELRPIDFPRAKAQIEYNALEKLHGKVNVPRPYSINRHAIAMEFIGDDVSAPLLSQVKVEAGMKEEILDNYNKAVELGLVHGDMSKFNIMMWDKPYLIDWP